MDELQSIVEMLMPIIENDSKYTPATIKLWFGDFKLISLDDKTAYFTTPTTLRKNILLARYKDIIKDALCEVLGFSVDIKIESVEEIEKREELEEAEPISPTPEDEAEMRDREEKIKSIIMRDPNDEKATLLDEYTFDNFIVGASNKFAKEVCFAVAKSPAQDYNPLFVHGNSGLGKTHLLCAIINYMKLKHPRLKIVYKKCEDFMNELIAAISDYNTDAFREKYRKADVLLIDDIQFIAGKVSTQEEFFHTFSFLYESNKQIILTSDRPPHEIKPLEDRLRTRFEGGLIADIQPPSPELRTAIIKKKSEAMDLQIPPDLVEYLSERLHENIRQIEGVLKKLHAITEFTNSIITKETVDQVISVIDPGNIPIDILIERTISSVCKLYAVTKEQLLSKKKTDSISNARHICIWIIRKLTDKSLKDIGVIFNNRDHTTIMASINKVDTLIKTKKNTEKEINSIIKEVKGQ